MFPPPQYLHNCYWWAGGGGKTSNSYQPSLSLNTPASYMLGHVINSQSAMMHSMCAVHVCVAGNSRCSSGVKMHEIQGLLLSLVTEKVVKVIVGIA
jgi:hypothetical protein